MACSCGSKNQQTWEVQRPDGTTERGLSQIEAAALARRVGGTYRNASGA